jgi:hypothetical protein
MPVTEGWVYRIDAVRPDFAPGEPGNANELCLILTSRYGASVDIEYYEENDVVMSQTVDIAPSAIEIICVPSQYAIEARSTAPFAVMSRQVFAGAAPSDKCMGYGIHAVLVVAGQLRHQWR